MNIAGQPAMERYKRVEEVDIETQVRPRILVCDVVLHRNR